MQARKARLITVPLVALGLLAGQGPASAAPADTRPAAKAVVAKVVVAKPVVKKTTQNRFNPVAFPVSAEAMSVVIGAAISKDADGRYRAGGSGPNAFDCSGFVKWAYAQAGISVPHGSRNLLKIVQRVSKADLAPGDLVFSGRGKGGIQHVAIYIGDGKVIHATNGGVSAENQVRIDDLDGSWVMDHTGYGRIVQ
jgi:cell wall-associated NlpC family hydrolase